MSSFKSLGSHFTENGGFATIQSNKSPSYCSEKSTKLQFTIRCIIHFIFIETMVMCEGALVGWYDNFIDGLIIFVSVIIIYAFVWFYSYKTEKTTANNINNALNEINADEDEE